jgi:hypothetical protein
VGRLERLSERYRDHHRLEERPDFVWGGAERAEPLRRAMGGPRKRVLARLFDDNGEWSSLTVAPGSGATACGGMLVAIYVDLLARRAHMAPLGRAVVAAINGGAEAVDRRFAAALREPRQGTIFANYHVTAVA